MRLADGSNDMEGRVEILYDGAWGTICDDVFDGNDNGAMVICRQLGYPNGEVATYASFPQGSGPIRLDDVNCDGTESEVTDCSHPEWGANNCGHREDVGVICCE